MVRPSQLPSSGMTSSKNDLYVSSQPIELNSENSTPWKPQAHEICVLMVLASISLMAALDATILVTILSDISQALSGSATETFWTGTSYLLTSAVSQPAMAMCALLFGSCIMTITALALFAVGSIVCATAPSFAILLTGRFVQGVGGGGIIVLVQVICAEMIPLKQRPQWFSLILLAWAVGTIAGPLLGSILVQASSFRLIFWINLPFCGIGILALPLAMRGQKIYSINREDLAKADWIGCFLLSLSLTGLLLGLSWAGIQFPWGSWQTLLPVVAGISGFITLWIWERSFAQLPFLRPSLFRSRSLCAAYLGTFIQGLILLCVLYYVPLYFATVRLQSPISSAVSILPISCSMLPVSALTSHVMTRKGSYRWAIWAGWFFTVVGAGHLPLLSSKTSSARSVITFAVFGLGTGMTLTSMNFGIQAMVDQSDAALAASMYSFIRSVGMSVGVTVGGNMFQNLMASSLRGRGISEAIATDAERYVHVLKFIKDESRREKIIDAYLDGFHGVFIAVAATSALAWIICFMIKNTNFEGKTRGRSKTT